MKKLLFLFVLILSISSCDKDTSNFKGEPDKGSAVPDGEKKDSTGNQLTANESELLLDELAGEHKCQIIYYKDNKESNKIDNLICKITAKDSSYVVEDFPVKLFSNYIYDEDIKNMVANAPNSTLNGKLFPYNYSKKLCFVAPQTLSYCSDKGDKLSFEFYSGTSNYSFSGYMNNGSYAIVNTMYRIQVDNKEVDNNFFSMCYMAIVFSLGK